ncbi:hypothetical protein [Cetobacterium sp.]|uniref:hypothetical protein n=1 Tax=Cetobacterium sp. TaxID=2071632 RepID=UPI003F357155
MGTVNINLKQVSKFEEKLMKHGKILNLKPEDEFLDDFFIEKGHKIECLKIEKNKFDISDERYEGIVKESVIRLMNSLKHAERFIGIWGMDTLLNLDRLDIYYVLNRLYSVLVEKGLLYLSFRVGEEDCFEDGKWCTYFTENELIDLIGFTDFSIVEIENVENHINLILKK